MLVRISIFPSQNYVYYSRSLEVKHRRVSPDQETATCDLDWANFIFDQGNESLLAHLLLPLAVQVHGT